MIADNKECRSQGFHVTRITDPKDHRSNGLQIQRIADPNHIDCRMQISLVTRVADRKDCASQGLQQKPYVSCRHDFAPSIAQVYASQAPHSNLVEHHRVSSSAAT